MSLLKVNCFVFIFLAIATVVSHTWIDQYEQTGPELLTGGWKFRTSAASRINITENGLTLGSGDSQIGTSAYQNVPLIEHGAILKLSADIKCVNVVPGKKPWNLARLLLVQNDGKKDRWDLPHTVAALTGTADWKNYRSVFTVSPETRKIQVIAQLSQSAGSLQIKNTQLYPVSETLIFRWARGIILFAWSAFSLLLVASCFFLGKKKILFRLLMLSVFASIIAGTTYSGPFFQDSKLRWYPAKKGAGNDGSKAKEFYG